MAQKTRPLSPHLQIYSPQLTSVLSILHRLTGIILSFGLFFLAVWLYAEATTPPLLPKIISGVRSILGKLFIAALLFSFWYHFLNGIRHLIWDAGWMLDLKSVYATGYFTVCFSFLITGICCVFIWLL